MFFHATAVVDGDFSELQGRQTVEYTEGRGPKGPHAEYVRPV